MDRDPHSRTYGCFDRNYWHYRVADFPSGMAQEFVWPLALAYTLDIPGSAFHRQESLRGWAIAGMRFAARSAHRDGSCDDYFPYERAVGATAFSLLACLESYRLLNVDDAEIRSFLARRTDWLANRRESGKLSNHEALTVLCLLRAGQILGTAAWDRARAERLDRLLSWQDPEGWFQEYDGADPGYQTLTIWALAELQRSEPGPRLGDALRRAVRFVEAFAHPDGSFGGEYGSRNSYAYYPAGFEIVGGWLPEALALNDRVLAGLADGRDADDDDDHIIGHGAWSYFLAWQLYRPVRPRPTAHREGRTHFPNAGLLIDRRGGRTLIVALNKGGVFRHFDADGAAVADTGVSLMEARRGRHAVCHLVDRYETIVEPDRVVVRGAMGWAKTARMTVGRSVLLRLFMLTIGRFAADLVRALLQRLLITGKREAPYRFERTFEWMAPGWRVRDRVTASSWSGVSAAAISSHQNSIYVAVSRVFQPAQLAGFLDLTDHVRALGDGQPLNVERRL